MLRTLSIAVAAALFAGSVSAAPYELDKNGKCHDKANGQFAKQALCSGGAAPAGGVYKLNAAGKCTDAKGKYVKADMCAGMAAPAATKASADTKATTKKK